MILHYWGEGHRRRRGLHLLWNPSRISVALQSQNRQTHPALLRECLSGAGRRRRRDRRSRDRSRNRDFALFLPLCHLKEREELHHRVEEVGEGEEGVDRWSRNRNRDLVLYRRRRKEERHRQVEEGEAEVGLQKVCRRTKEENHQWVEEEAEEGEGVEHRLRLPI